MSSTDSTSPNLSTSPLGSFGGISHALPSPAGGLSTAQRSTSHRSASYEDSVDQLAGGTNDLAHEEDETLDALRRYRQGLYSYTSSRFDRFKVDLERKNALDEHHPTQA
ncbi:hypothetical protein JCM8208_006581 [Rhodotorula glutinis]